MNSKDKGNSFERKIANLLSVRFRTATGLDQAFRRNIDSGSFFGGSNQRRTVTHNTENAVFGDINCPNNFKYAVECKHYKEAPSFKSIMKQDVKAWDLWIGQAQQDAKNSNKLMLLIIKYNNVDEIVILDALPEGVHSAINYKGNFVVPLEEVLALKDNVFFNKEDTTIIVKS